MSSINQNPLAQGQITDDPRFNERFGLAVAPGGGTVLWSVVGVPPAALGQNGDLATRIDGTEAGHTLLYHKEAGAWVATAA